MKKIYFLLWIRFYCYNNKIILKIRRGISSRTISSFILLLLLPYFVLITFFSFLYETFYGKNYIEKLKKKEDVKKFDNEIAIVAISKNEGPYITEWIEFHRIVGINKFYFYDNESSDNTFEILRPYIQQGIVEYQYIEGKAKQLVAYNDAIKKHKDEVKYMAFIDLDEYIKPTEDFKSIIEIVESIILHAPKGTVGIGVNWALFGSSGFLEKQEKPLTQTFLRRAENDHFVNSHIKVICNPRFVKEYISPHYPILQLGACYVNENTYERLWGWFADDRIYKNLRINHYFTKSKSEYIMKISRGLGDRLGQYDMNKFYQYDLNDIFDDSMKVYDEELHKRLTS